MKKKLFGIISVLVIVALLGVGCNGKKEVVTFHEATDYGLESTQSTSDTQSVVTEESDSVVTEPDVSEKDEKGDPALVALEVTEDFAKENNLKCLYRDGKVYGLTGTTLENCEKYGIGYYYIATRTGSAHNPYAYYCHYLDLGFDRFFTAGDLPEIVLKEDDKIITYNQGYELILSEVENVGYTPEWEVISGELYRYDKNKSESPTINQIQTWENFKLEDNNGNLLTENMDDFTSAFRGINPIFDQNKKYWVSYVRDFEEYKWDFEANCEIFDVKKDGREYRIEPELDMDLKCYTFDLSQVESGLYLVRQGALNEGGYLVKVP